MLTYCIFPGFMSGQYSTKHTLVGGNGKENSDLFSSVSGSYTGRIPLG